MKRFTNCLMAGCFLCLGTLAMAQENNLNIAPDPHDVPVPEIRTPISDLPGIEKMPAREELPDPLTMNDGTKVTTKAQWPARREEMQKILSYYAVGQAPPPPGNVKGTVSRSESLADGKIKYRLVHLTFGPDDSLSMDIGIFTPAEGGPFATVIEASGGGLPGSTVRPRLPQGRGPGHTQDVLSMIGPSTKPAQAGPMLSPSTRPVRGGFRGGFGGGFGGGMLERTAATNPALHRGYAYVTFDTSDCAEDSTLRLPDGSFAYRTTRFGAAYPGYDWGILRTWAWGASRVVDYLETDTAIDKSKLLISGVSRWGKAALIAGAFDERFAVVAPVASSGGGTPAYRFSGFNRGGKEGLTEMLRKFPNWFSPKLYQFYAHPEKLPFDNHYYMALCAPRGFIALEGSNDQNVVANGVRQSYLGAMPVYALFDADNHLGVSWADRRHGKVQGDWDAELDFADMILFGKKVNATFDKFPPTAAVDASVLSTQPANREGPR